jgi:hypothetical protein
MCQTSATNKLDELRRVRDWKGLLSWARTHGIFVEHRGKHLAIFIGQKPVFISKTGGSSNRGALNARAQILRELNHDCGSIS